MSLNKLEKAIERAYNKCVEDTMDLPMLSPDIVYCPRTFDGWSCWNDTPAGQVTFVPCPVFIIGFDPKRLAHKFCDWNGTWFRHPETNVSWSNYTTCVDMDDLAMRRTINILNITGYAVSLVALLISLCIFFYFRSLRCVRITIHKQLFFSFVMNNSLWLVWYAVMETPQVVHDNEPACQILHVVLQYFLVSNYFWMFCEGFYLHTILVMTFVDKQSIMNWLYVIGWGIPAILTVTYAVARNSYPAETEHCWINDSVFQSILTAPVCLSMLANLIFLVNIVKVLVTKLRAVHSSDTDQTRKAVRATIILIPLLGLHFLVTPFRPKTGASGEHIYAIVSAVVTSFQGFSVAFLFCFCNTEIIMLVRKKYHVIRYGKGRHPSWVTTTTFATSRTESIRQNSSRRKSSRRQGNTTCNNHICLADITPLNKKSEKKKTFSSKRKNDKSKDANASLL